jgi:hypothetical protein
LIPQRPGRKHLEDDVRMALDEWCSSKKPFRDENPARFNAVESRSTSPCDHDGLKR